MQGTSQEVMEYKRLIGRYKRQNKVRQRPNSNFGEWLVHKRYTAQGWKCPKTWEQDEFMTREQYFQFRKYQSETCGQGKPDLFFYKLGKTSLVNKFVEVKYWGDTLQDNQKHFIREFCKRKKIFDVELVYVLKTEEVFYSDECKKPRIYHKFSYRPKLPPGFLCMARQAEKEERKEQRQAEKEDEKWQKEYDKKFMKEKKMLKKISASEKIKYKKKKEMEDEKMLNLWEAEMARIKSGGGFPPSSKA
jgi:hypothetical protein